MFIAEDAAGGDRAPLAVRFRRTTLNGRVVQMTQAGRAGANRAGPSLEGNFAAGFARRDLDSLGADWSDGSPGRLDNDRPNDLLEPFNCQPVRALVGALRAP